MTRDEKEEKLIREEIKDEVFFKPAYSLLPAFLGLPMALASWVVNKPLPWVTGIGAGLTLFSIGLYVTRVCLNWGNAGNIRDRILKRRANQAREAVEKALNTVRKKLVSDGDPQTEEMFDRLLVLQQTIRQEIEKEICGLEQGVTLRSVEELVGTSVGNLEESVVLLEKAEETSISSLKEVSLKRRQELIDETGRSIDSIERILLAFIQNNENYSVAKSSNIRAELEAQLEISERVKRRMNDWQTGATELES